MTTTQRALPTIKAEWEWVGPDEARKFLARNMEDQRTLRKVRVRTYANDMREGRWLGTGHTIKIDTNGDMIDGQHQMEAVILSGATVPMFIARGVPPEAFQLIDTGLARSIGEVLKKKKYIDRFALGSLVRRIILWERGNYIGTGAGTANDRTVNPMYATPSHSEITERLAQDPDLFPTALLRGGDMFRAQMGTKVTAAQAFFLFTKVDEEQTKTFWDMVLTGANLPPNHAALTLRNRLPKVRKTERLLPHEIVALWIRAWNAFREDRTLDKLTVSKVKSKLTNTNYPRPI